MATYYTYAYLREDGTPYYIGKGTGRRAWKKHLNLPVPKEASRIQLLHIDLTEDQAFLMEKQLIEFYGRKDLGTGILRNLTNGGEGASGYRHSGEHIEHMSSIMRGRKGTPHTDENRTLMSITRTGRKFGPPSIESNLQRSASMKGRPNWCKDKKRPLIECPHCSKLGASNLMKRYHFDNCKVGAK